MNATYPTTKLADGHTITGITYLPCRWECTCGERGTDGSAGVEYHRRRVLTDITDDEIDDALTDEASWIAALAQLDILNEILRDRRHG